jgi:hypothetical protein
MVWVSVKVSSERILVLGYRQEVGPKSYWCNMETTKTIFDNEHPSTLTSMVNLASIYDYQGRWKETETLQVQVLETSKGVLGRAVL